MSKLLHKLQPNLRTPGFLNFIFTCVCVEADRALIKWQSHGGSVTVPLMRVPVHFLLPGFLPAALQAAVDRVQVSNSCFFFLQPNLRALRFPSLLPHHLLNVEREARESELNSGYCESCLRGTLFAFKQAVFPAVVKP